MLQVVAYLPWLIVFVSHLKGTGFWITLTFPGSIYEILTVQSDVFSSFIVIIGVSLAGKESDEGHQYGHDRLECVAAIILAVVLLITGAGIGIDGVNKIINGTNGNQTIPGIIAMVAAIISIATKEWMYWFTRSAAKKINSGAVMADAWHHRSDALSSIGALIGQ